MNYGNAKIRTRCGWVRTVNDSSEPKLTLVTVPRHFEAPKMQVTSETFSSRAREWINYLDAN